MSGLWVLKLASASSKTADFQARHEFWAEPSDALEPSNLLSMKEGWCVKLSVAGIPQTRPNGSLWSSGAHLSIASWMEDKADGSSLRWRIALETVRRPGVGGVLHREEKAGTPRGWRHPER
jgi:hypothetical protein